MFALDQVILVSTVPTDSLNKSNTSTSDSKYVHTPVRCSNKSSSTKPASDASGQIFQIDLSNSATLSFKLNPFTYKESSIPKNCLSIASQISSTSKNINNSLFAYHPTQAALILYSVGKDRPVSRSFGHEPLLALQASPCGRFAVGGLVNGNLIIWSIVTGDIVCIKESAHFQAVSVIRFSPDGQIMATGGLDALIKVWSWPDLISSSLSKDVLLYSFPQHSCQVTDLSFSLTTIGRRGRLLSAGLDGKSNYYDLCDGQLLLSLTFPSPITSIAMNAVETQIFAGSVDGKIYPISLNSQNDSHRHRDEMTHKSGPVNCLKFSLDGRILISTGFGIDGAAQVSIWDPQTFQLIKNISLGSGLMCTNILITHRFDFGNTNMTSSTNSAKNNSNTTPYTTASNTSTTNVIFKRIGNPIVPISASVPLRSLQKSSSSESNGGLVSSEIIKDITRENEELKKLNSELCSIVCKGQI